MRVILAGEPAPLAAALATRVLEAGGEAIGTFGGAVEGWPEGALAVPVPSTRTSMRDWIAEWGGQSLVVFAPAVAGRPRWLPGRRKRGSELVELAHAAGEAGVRRLILWSGAEVYGRDGGRGGWLERDVPASRSALRPELGALDEQFRQLARGHSAPALYVFRAADVVGPGYTDTLEGLLDARILPRLRHDAPLQFLHELDALHVAWRALHEGHPGVYNVAGDGLLRFSEICRAVGSPAVRLPRLLAGPVALGNWAASRALRPRSLLRLARGLPVMDNGRLKTHFGFRPRFSGRQAIATARAASLSTAM